ncbi:MAG TPA: hypothetical protein VF903_08980 [Nitrospirota bacterium]
MRKVIMAFGYAFLVFLVFSVTGIASIVVLGKRLDKESRAYVDAAIPAIVSEWDVQELQKRASPEFQESVDDEDLENDFETLKQLGRLEQYHGSVGASDITVSFQYCYEITADYTANADFESGSAEIQVSLIRHGGQWQILDLKMNPLPYSENKSII